MWFPFLNWLVEIVVDQSFWSRISMWLPNAANRASTPGGTDG
jgi:hypothetical protein